MRQFILSVFLQKVSYFGAAIEVANSRDHFA